MFKEVVIKDFANPHQFRCIYRTLGEDFVHIGAVARELGGKPHYGFPLLRQSFFKEISNVHCVRVAERLPVQPVI